MRVYIVQMRVYVVLFAYAMNNKMLRQMRGLTNTRFLARPQLEKKMKSTYRERRRRERRKFRDILRSIYF